MNKFLQLLMLPLVVACNSSTADEQKMEEAQLPDTLINKAAAINDLKFDTYCNARFGYCIDYPGILFPQPESENGDGRVFKDKQGNEALIVFGRLSMDENGETVSLEKQFKDDLQDISKETGNKITYQKLGKSFFVISGYKNGKIFYQKTILKEDAFAYAILRYDETEKGIYDKLSETIFASFK